MRGSAPRDPWLRKFEFLLALHPALLSVRRDLQLIQRQQVPVLLLCL